MLLLMLRLSGGELFERLLVEMISLLRRPSRFPPTSGFPPFIVPAKFTQRRNPAQQLQSNKYIGAVAATLLCLKGHNGGGGATAFKGPRQGSRREMGWVDEVAWKSQCSADQRFLQDLS